MIRRAMDSSACVVLRGVQGDTGHRPRSLRRDNLTKPQRLSRNTLVRRTCATFEPCALRLCGIPLEITGVLALTAVSGAAP